MRYKAAVFIGRFQPIHSGHLVTIQKALDTAQTLIIAVGSYKRPSTIKNPWSTEQRIEMIRQCLTEEQLKRVYFIGIRDHKYNNNRWASEVYSKAVLAGATQDKSTALIGSYKDDSSFYLNMFPQWSSEIVELVRNDSGKVLSAVDIRHVLFRELGMVSLQDKLHPSTSSYVREWQLTEQSDYLKNEYEFLTRYKQQWDAAPFAPVFVTTDTVVIKSGHILLIKRKGHPGKGLFALPGGFLNPNESIETCAIRELKEETKIKIPKAALHKSIVHSESKVFDHPQRSDRGRTVTHAFLVNLEEGPLPEVKGSDDASIAFWLPLADLQSFEDRFYEDHYDIINHMVSRF